MQICGRLLWNGGLFLSFVLSRLCQLGHSQSKGTCALIIHVVSSPRECPGVSSAFSSLYAGNLPLLLLLIPAVASVGSMRCQSPETASKKVIHGQIHSESVTYQTRFEFMSVSIPNALRSRISI